MKLVEVLNQFETELETVRKEVAEVEKENFKLKENLNLIWKEINNAHYFGDMKSRNFYNLIHEVAEIIKPNYEEIGKEFIE